MDVDEFTKHQREHLDQLAKEFDSVCEQRLKQIHERLCNEHPPYPPPHTVTLARAVHVLAMRVLSDEHPAKHPGNKSYTSKGRHGLHLYWVTVFKLNDGVTKAAQTEALHLRDRLTGFPIQEWHSPSKDELVEWEKCAIFPTNDRQAAERRALGIMITTNWHLLATHFDTGIVVSLTEIDAWAAGIGVATNGEVSELLQASEAQTAKRVRITAAAIAAEERGEKFDLAKFETDAERARAINRATQAQWAGIKNDLADRHYQHTEHLHNEWQEKLDPAPPPRVEPHTAPAQTATPVVPVIDEPAKRRRKTWRDVTEVYLECTFKELQCPTVKEFFAALTRKAGNGSPFDKGVGQNSGSLFARDVNAVVTYKMIEGFVTGLRKKM